MRSSKLVALASRLPEEPDRQFDASPICGLLEPCHQRSGYGLKEDLRSAIGALDHAFARELNLPAAVRAVFLALELTSVDGVEQSFCPIDIPAKQAAIDQVVDIGLDALFR